MWSDDLPEEPPVLPPTLTPSVEGERPCPHCGLQTVADAAWCRHCGLALDAAPYPFVPGTADATAVSATSVAPATGTAPEPWRPIEPLSGATRILLVLCGVVAAGSLIADVARFVFIGDLLGDPTSADLRGQLQFADDWQALVGLLVVAVSLPTIVLFLIWVYRVAENVPVLGSPRWPLRPVWAVAWWFVPVANLILPKRVLDDIWRRSDPDAAEVLGADVRAARVPTSQLVWWICLLLLAASWVVALLVSSDTSLERERVAAGIEIVTSAAALAAAVLGQGMVGDIAARQERRAARLGLDRPPADPRYEIVQPEVGQRVVPGYPPPPSLPPTTAAGVGWSVPADPPSPPPAGPPVWAPPTDAGS